MFPFKFELRIKNDLLTKRMERRVNREVKEVLQQVAIMHKVRHIPRHFTRQAYSLYTGLNIHKKKTGDPLVFSGHLKSIVKGQKPEVGGTARQSWLRVRFGRPAQYTGQKLRQKVLARIKTLRKLGVRETWKEAEGNVLKKAGYGAKLRNYIRRNLTTLRGSEQQFLQSFAKKELVKRIKANTGRTVEVVRIY